MVDVLREQVPSLRGRGFALRTAFPNRLYEDHAESLAAAGLVPNAVMMVRCHELCETSGSGCFLSGTGFSEPYMAAISQLDVQSSLNLLSRQTRQRFLRSVNSLWLRMFSRLFRTADPFSPIELASFIGVS